VLDSEFNVGDYIQWENNEGTVEPISLRVTRVETVDGELVTIPNTNPICDRTHPRYRRAVPL
jgi:small-conductance mechanosensitive channel